MLKLDHFAPLVGQTFTLLDEATGAHPAALAEARALPVPPYGERQPFALLFEGPREPVLPQRIYTLQHPAFEALEVFLVPLGQGPSSVQYEAIFN
jgi:hypothetical protein